MGIREDFKNYWDGNDMLAPNPVAPGTLSGCDNAPMFTSEFYVMLKKLGLLTDQDKADYQHKIGQCVDSAGMLCRVPVGQDDGQEQVDDYYGTLNACRALGNTVIPRQFLAALIKNKGSMDNENPGEWQWTAFMPRQPQLIACMISAAFPSWKNPLHILIRTLAHPLFLYSAVIIATAGMFSQGGGMDTWRLAWHVQNNLKGTSPLCWLAAKIWRWRLYKYFANGMNDVAAQYYQPNGNNPYQKYWIT